MKYLAFIFLLSGCAGLFTPATRLEWQRGSMAIGRNLPEDHYRCQKDHVYHSNQLYYSCMASKGWELKEVPR